jgi:16S rRNA (cytosine1402-N4)-methyltransferase
LQRLSERGRLLALDRDPEAIAHGVQEFGGDARIELVHAAFDQLEALASSRGWRGQVSGVLLDLGVSSPQLDEARRGFSFMRDGPLDMRMDPSRGESAAQWLARVDEAELERVLREYGEERFARRIAAAIVAAGRQTPLLGTVQLARVVAAAHPRWPKDRHPATQSFQAIRIAINDELTLLQRALEQALEVLAIGGRLVVISFHSLEDRIVKRFFSSPRAR